MYVKPHTPKYKTVAPQHDCIKEFRFMFEPNRWG